MSAITASFEHATKSDCAQGPRARSHIDLPTLVSIEEVKCLLELRLLLSAEAFLALRHGASTEAKGKRTGRSVSRPCNDQNDWPIPLACTPVQFALFALFACLHAQVTGVIV